MGQAINTAGVSLSYAVELTANTKPTTGYTVIPDIKAVPEMNPEPSALETTDLSQTEYKTYIEGLKDLGGALSFTANFTTELTAVWETLVSEYKTAKADSKNVWFQIIHPKLEKSVFFTGEPSSQGLPAIEVDSVLETSCFITPTSAPEWATKIVPSESA